MKKNIAIITARGGSKRIAKKNIKLFCGKPIISFSIQAALKSGIFDEVMVSTDSDEIAGIAIQYGASVPFRRSEKTSDDFATTSDVLLEVLNEYEQRGNFFETACCIYPTAPFLTSGKLKHAMKVLQENEVDSVFPVVGYSYPPQRGLVIKNGFLELMHPEFIDTKSQDFEHVYHDCGQFYLFRVSSFKQNKKIMSSKSMPIIMPEMEVQDIDTMEDWELAEMKFRMLREKDGFI